MSKDILSRQTLRVYQEYLVSNNTLRGIEGLFEDAGIIKFADYEPNESSVRRKLVMQYYRSLNTQKWSDVKKLLRVYEQIIFSLKILIEKGLTVEGPKDMERLLEYLRRDGFVLKDEKIIYNDKLIFLEDSIEPGTPAIDDLFEYQFPAGLPFGIIKPDFAVVAENGIQKLRFELRQGMAILKKNIYPNFSFKNLEALFGVDQTTNVTMKQSLVKMNQTGAEKEFFMSYAKSFNMAASDVPVLIPQAWVQWHSLPKRNLREDNSIHADDLYRIDFVAFWRNKRYAILVDDISHYSKKSNKLWLSDEESYAKRLKEDRKLRKEKWVVFRVSNWEIRNTELISEILADLRELIGF